MQEIFFDGSGRRLTEGESYESVNGIGKINPNPAELTTERTEGTEDDLFMLRCG